MANPLENLDTDKLRNFVYNNRAFLAVSLIFVMALYLRYQPTQNMEYLQALDSYMAYRVSQHIAFEGSLPAVDFLRYFPYAMPTYLLHQGNVFIPAILYWMGPFLVFDYISWAQFYPALMGSLTVFVVYFIGKEAFDRATGVSSAFFLATIAGVMHRSAAGFFQKEPTAIVFMLISIYFFLRAWKRSDWRSGIGSGLALGIATITWGGSQMIWLLYPLTVGIMLWINEDIRRLVKAYTPAVLVAGFLAFSFNHSRFWITDSLYLVNLGMLMFLWSRYLVEELQLLSKEQIPYYTPAASVTGLIVLALSPLYSNFIADKFVGFLQTATRTGGQGDIVGGTVAENTAVSLGQLSSQLGAISSSRAHMFFEEPVSTVLQPMANLAGVVANINGAWPLAFIGVVFLSTTVLTMVLRKLDIIEKEIKDLTYYKLVIVVLVLWTTGFSIFFEASTLIAAGPAALAIIGGIGILYSLEELGEREISFEWHYVLILVWIVSNILATVTQSRLIFMASFPTAFVAGYMFANVGKRIMRLKPESAKYLFLTSGILLIDIMIITALVVSGLQFVVAVVLVALLNGVALMASDKFPEDRTSLEGDGMKVGALGIVIAVTVFVNVASGFTAASSLGGSPNALWMENLEYLEEETPGDSVVLSWWDYGYHFHTIGERATVADGGNHGYYSNERKITYPLADFFSSTEPEEHMDFLEKHSADYIVLDETMIGKYSAVSQIANRDNSQFDNMIPLDSSRNIANELNEEEENVVRFSTRGLQAYVPVEFGENSVDISSAPTLETQQGRSEIGCVLTDSGVEEFEGTQPMELQGFGEVCIAKNPYFSMERALVSAQQGQPMQAQVVLVPRSITDTTLVRLYLMDGHGIDFVEKVEEGSNDYIKMWEIQG